MKVVVLDTATLPVPLTCLAWTTGWKQYPATSPDKIVDATGDTAIAVANKVQLRRADLMRMPQLQFICVGATGYDCVDVAACHD
jgi:glycerate dehydrogenase